jgi:hypothetical protein
MRKLALLAALAAGFAAAAAAAAAPPVFETFTFRDHFVDTGTCGFPVAGDVVFTNDATSFRDAAGNEIGLQLHQSLVGTLTANGVTLREHVQETIFVEFVDGIPVVAKHVGVLDSIVGPGGPVFLRTGQAVFAVVFDPVSGFYVDGPRIARHGVRADFDPVAFCAAFS